ncbi:MAG: metallophosphoesterase [Chthoniobacter sp.]|nr:metallophosphoesterase [Chthoniobacter sp.]
MLGSLTILQVSDVQFGKNHRFGNLGALDENDVPFDSLFKRLSADLNILEDLKVRPDLVIVSGDLAELGAKEEFDDALRFIEQLSEHVRLPSSRFVIVPGNHDINRKLCNGYFLNCEGEGTVPMPPYWPKWKHFKTVFDRFYRDVPSVKFTEPNPWTLIEFPELNTVVAAMNSTMAESHLNDSHYGHLGEAQLEWFAAKLAPYRERGWFRIGVVHHNLERGIVRDDENLRDRDDLERILAPYLNVVFHGHTHVGRIAWLSQVTPILSTGSAALKQQQRPEEVGNQYQLVRFTANGFERWLRRYDPDGKKWIGDTRYSQGGIDWHLTEKLSFEDSAETFGPTTEIDAKEAREPVEADDPEERPIVVVTTPISEEVARQKLKSLPRFRLRVENQHRVIRNEEKEFFIEVLRVRQSVWLVADWGLGKEGFLAAAFEKMGGPGALNDVYRLQCGSAKTCDELLTEAESQLGLSFQEFFAAVATSPFAVLVLDDIPPIFVTGAEREAFERQVRPIFDFCPSLKLVFVARQAPIATDPNEIVLLRPLEIQEMRRYLRQHVSAQAGLDGDHEIERISSWSGGLPMHLDRLLERRRYLTLSAILDEEAELNSETASEPIPEALKEEVSALSNATDKRSIHSFRLLKVLTVLRDGETYGSIRRFYEREPFIQEDVHRLVRAALLEDVPIAQTATDLGLVSLYRPQSQPDAPQLLRIPRQVRDYVNSLISDEERDEIIKNSTGLFFGQNWWKGKIRLRTTLSNAYGQSSIAGPGNEHVVARYLLAKALAKHNKRQVERYAMLAINYCNKLIGADRFRDAVTASGAVLDLLRDTSFDKHFVEASGIYGRALRMTGREEHAIEVLEHAIELGGTFLTDDIKAYFFLNISLASEYKDKKKALESAEKVLELAHKESSDAYQAQGVIFRRTLSGNEQRAKLIELERTARNKDRVGAANNIALELARSGGNLRDSLKLIDKVIRSSRDNYNRTRAIIEKVTLLHDNRLDSELSDEDRRLLDAAYSYSYAQRIGNLHERCHTVLWRMFTVQGLITSLLRLYRFSSFIWRLRDKIEPDKRYLRELDTVDLAALPENELPELKREVHYLLRRRIEYPPGS